MKQTLVFSLLAIWAFSQITPSVLAIIDKNDVAVVFNLNEEEQNEYVSGDADTKQLLNFSQINFYFIPVKKTRAIGNYLFSQSNPYFEIPLPPPESLI